MRVPATYGGSGLGDNTQGFRRDRLIWLAWILGGFALSGLLILAGWQGSRASAQAGPPLGSVGPDAILDDPRQYLGQTVAVDGEVARVFGRRAVALRSRSARQGLLVVLSDAAEAGPLRQGQAVRVLAMVRPMNRQEARMLPRALAGEIDPADLLGTYRDDPYLLALQVRPTAKP